MKHNENLTQIPVMLHGIQLAIKLLLGYAFVFAFVPFIAQLHKDSHISFIQGGLLLWPMSLVSPLLGAFSEKCAMGEPLSMANRMSVLPRSVKVLVVTLLTSLVISLATMGAISLSGSIDRLALLVSFVLFLSMDVHSGWTRSLLWRGSTSSS
jgi:hypothetical protein